MSNLFSEILMQAKKEEGCCVHQHPELQHRKSRDRRGGKGEPERDTPAVHGNG